MDNQVVPIVEYDYDEGIISPLIVTRDVVLPSHIKTAIMLFERRMDESIFRKCEPVYYFKGGSFTLPQFIYDNRILVALTPLGSAAAAALMEELISLGVKRFIACGSAGLINHDIDSSRFVLVKSAIRDEGTSYHYLPPKRTVDMDKDLSSKIEEQFKVRNLEYLKGITWTTDAFYRETPKRVARRVKEGAICVEMECAALSSVAQYRKVQFAQILYFSDIVKQTAWSGFVSNSKEIKTKLNELTLDIALSINEYIE